MKALKNISRIQVRNETLILLLGLYESKGKSFYYDELFKRDQNSFKQIALEKDIAFLEKVMDLKLTDARIKFCTKNNFVPKTKDEQLLENIKSILTLIHNEHSKFELLVNEIHELAKMLGNEHTSISFNKIPVNESGLLASNKTVSTREQLEELINEYKKLLKMKQYEEVTLITNFYIDFINMKIFNKYNDLVGLIVLYAMLYQVFSVFKYISFFEYYSKQLERIDYAIKQASFNWESSFPQTDTLNEIIFNILVECYDELDDLSHQYDFEKDLNKSDNIENTILKFQKLFSKNDLRKLHPTVSDSTIDRTLQRLKEEGKIMPIGAGRSSRWQVLVENNDFQQMDIFNQ